MASRNAVTQRFSTWSWSGALEALRAPEDEVTEERQKPKKSSSSVLLREPPHQGEKVDIKSICGVTPENPICV